MRHAQLARTLAASRSGAIAQVAWAPGPHRVRHALDRDGFPLLLCRAGGALDNALSPDVALVINVGTAPAKVWISGWAVALNGIEAKAAALEFAAANPLSDLLDVGRGFRLYRMDVAEVRLELQLENGDGLIDIDLDDYASARVSSEPVM